MTTNAEAPAHRVSGLAPGDNIEVFNRFNSRWVGGFEIAETGTNGYRVRRFSDRSVLPVEVDACDVRAAHPSAGSGVASASRVTSYPHRARR
ncbi:MAG TPA: hypothetical protein VKI64_09585 [Acidimicrobiales bacterium]|nr:hypothetical protein [Acidimicrobiales bacterium]